MIKICHLFRNFSIGTNYARDLLNMIIHLFLTVNIVLKKEIAKIL
jgi:hypothetical protein